MARSHFIAAFSGTAALLAEKQVVMVIVSWQSLLLTAAGIVLFSAATGVGQGLRISLRALVLRLMRVKDPESNDAPMTHHGAKRAQR